MEQTQERIAPVIELDNLDLRLGNRMILNRLQGSLCGRCIGLLGPNGSGKSTLINTLLGFYPPTFGTARIFGKDIRGRDIKSIRNLIRYMAELSGLPPSHAMERAHEAFFYVGLGEVRYRKLGTYSLGMKQLAKLAQAIVHGPKLLFLDEPTNGLDPAARQRMIQLIKEIRDTGEIHIVISSHLLRDVEECCEEILIVKDGRIVVYCNLEEERRANRKFLELELRGSVESFTEAVASLGCEYALTSERRLKIVLQDGVETRDLYKVAAERQVQIRRLNYKR